MVGATEGNAQDYYTQNKAKIIKSINGMIPSLKIALKEHIEHDAIDQVAEETMREFEVSLGALPDIGGSSNAFMSSFLLATVAKGLIHALEQRQLEASAIGKIIYDTTDIYANSFSPVLRWLARMQQFSKKSVKKLETYAIDTQSRRYPENWVVTNVPGDGNSFDYGYDVSECAVLKLFKKAGLEKYMPYVCATDLAIAKALGTGMQQTQRLSLGGRCCNFRYKKGGSTQPGWPVKDLPESRNNP